MRGRGILLEELTWLEAEKILSAASIVVLPIGAAAKAKAEKPDLMLLDIVMPKVEGTTVLKEIKKLDPKAKVVMITAVGQDVIVKECMALGADDYITKPFDDHLVRETVAKHLK